MHSDQLDKGQKIVPEDTEMAVEALDASCTVKPTARDTTGAKGPNQDSTKGQCGSYGTLRGLILKLSKYAALSTFCFCFWLSDLKEVIHCLSMILCCRDGLSALLLLENMIFPEGES